MAQCKATWTNSATWVDPTPAPAPATGVVTDAIMPAVLVLVTGFVAMAFVLQNKKQEKKF